MPLAESEGSGSSRSGQCIREEGASPFVRPEEFKPAVGAQWVDGMGA